MPAHPFFHDLALVIVAAAIGAVIARRLRVSAIVGYLAAGVVIGPSLPLALIDAPYRIQSLSELGVSLVMFSIGLELSLARLGRLIPRAGPATLVQMSAMLWLGYLIGQLFGWSQTESLFAGAMISISSTMIASRVLSEIGAGQRLSATVIGILVIEDIVAVLLLAALAAIAVFGEPHPEALGTTAGHLALFLVLTIGLGFLIIPRLTRAIAYQQSRELLLLFGVAACFGGAIIAASVGFSVALGAFLAGALIAESGQADVIEHMVRPLRDVFAAVFFVSVGMLIEPVAVIANAGAWLALTVAVIVGQIVFVALGSFITGAGLRTAIRAGMCLAQIGELSFVIVALGVTWGAVSGRLMSLAVAVAATTTLLTPYLARASERVAQWVGDRLPAPVATFTALYTSWIEALGTHGGQAPRSRTRRLLLRLLADAAVITLIAIVTAALRYEAAAWLDSQLGLSARSAVWIVVGIAMAAAIPFVVGVARLAGALGAHLARTAIPHGAAGNVDLGAAPRRALVIGLQIAIVLAVLAPVLAITQPFLPAWFQLGVLGVVIAFLGLLFWRRAEDLQGHVKASAQIAIAALARQRDLHAAAERPLPEPPRSLLPGLGPITVVGISARDFCTGKSLSDLGVRGQTGAMVIALSHGDAAVTVPSGSERLAAGDVVTLTGSTEAIARARELLATGRTADD